MAQPHTGLPPAQYMHGHQKKLADVVDLPSVGPITVVRRDLGSFGAPDMQALYALMHEIVDAYGDKGKAGDESARARDVRQRVPDIPRAQTDGAGHAGRSPAAAPASTEGASSRD